MTDTLSQEQILELAEAFAMYDVDDTQEIPLKYIKTVLGSVGCVIPAASIQRVEELKLQEVSGDGAQLDFAVREKLLKTVTIRFDELLNLLGEGSNTLEGKRLAVLEQRSEALRQALSLFDHSGAGYLSHQDARKALLDTLSDVEFQDVLTQADPTNSGKLDIDQLCEVIVGAV